MAWEVRYARADDFEAIKAMSIENWRASCPQQEWSDDHFWTTFFLDYMADNRCAIFVVLHDGELCGFLLSGAYQYRAFVGLFTVQEVLYVKPEKRGTRAAAILMKKLIDWSITLGAKEIIGGNDNNVRSEQTSSFLARFGFRSCGYAMKKEL